MYLDKKGNSTAEETRESCAKEDHNRFYVKVNDAGFLYDPQGAYVREDDLVAIDPYKAKALYDWVQVEKYPYDNYFYFLKTKSRMSLAKAQNILNNSVGPNKGRFKRSCQ